MLEEIIVGIFVGVCSNILYDYLKKEYDNGNNI